MKRAWEAAAQPGIGPEDSKNTTERVAALDVGTHAAKLLVLDVTWDAAGLALRPLARAGIVTRLGEGGRESDVSGRERPIGPAAAERAEQAVGELASRARALGAEAWIGAGTGILRRAPNGRGIARRLEAVWGQELPILHAETEAALATLGARAGTGLEPPLVCVDLGGGSTELVAFRGRVRGQRSPRLGIHSFDVGCLVLAERYLGPSPSRKEVASLSRALIEAVAPVVPLGEEAGPWIAVGGTVTALATMDLGLLAHDPDRVHAHRLTREAIAGLVEGLTESSRNPGSASDAFHRQPVPVLLAGALLLGHLLSIHAVPGVTSSSWGLRHGLIIGVALSGRGGAGRRSYRDPRRSPAVAQHWATAKLPDLRLSGDSPNP